MTAVLQTSCGAIRTMDIPEFLDVIKVPIIKHRVYTSTDFTEAEVRAYVDYREFHCYEASNSIAWYLEG